MELKTAAEFLRASHISRWGIVATSKQQNIAEHMFRVWMLVSIWGRTLLNADEFQDALDLALLHDLPEIRTGDNPTPHKSPEVKKILADIEAAIFPGLAALEARISPKTKELVKYCDTAEAVFFLKVFGVGEHARSVMHLLETQMLARATGSGVFTQEELAFLKGEFDKTKQDT